MRLQTTIADPHTPLPAGPTRGVSKDMDYLAARLHARRSRMAEAERLDSLCRIRSLPELFQAVYPKTEIKDVLDFQRMLIDELTAELSDFRAYLSSPGADLIGWMLVRFQVENFKVLLRTFLTGAHTGEVDQHLISLPGEFALDIGKLAAAESPESLVGMVPKGPLRENLERALEVSQDHPRPFFFEAALDRFYFQGLLGKMGKLPREDREIVRPLVCQEVDIFHVMLVARGKFHYGLPPASLQTFHVDGARIPRSLFAIMLTDPELSLAASRVEQRVLDPAPFELGPTEGTRVIDAPLVEGLSWNRFLRLANLTFRRSHMGLGTVIGYAILRRVETANLITISEAIRSGLVPEKIRAHLIPRSHFAEAHTKGGEGGVE